MLIVLIIITALAVLAIALIAVGRIAGQLGSTTKQAIYDRAEAVDYVADRLPDDVTAQLSYEDLATLLQYHLDYLESRGVAFAQGGDASVGPTIASEDDALAYMIGRVSESGPQAEDVWLAQVIAGNEAYLRAIGAIGEPLD